MRKALLTCALAVLAVVLCACVSNDNLPSSTGKTSGETLTEAQIQERTEEILAALTTEQKVAQLFIITPEALTEYSTVTAAGRVSKDAYEKYPVGGLIYFAKNLEDATQTQTMLTNMQSYATGFLGLPVFLCVDEEGGDVARVANNDAFGAENVGDAWDLGQQGTAAVRAAAETIGGYLSALGFNVNFAPVADVVEDPVTSAIGYRSFGSDPEAVAAAVSAQVTAYLEAGVLPCVKHFPGIGSATADTHTDRVSIYSTLAALQEGALVPFVAAIEADAPFVMVGHVGLPQVTGSGIPASLSSIIVQGVLREDLGFEGVIITDALNMAAVSEVYTDRRIGVEVLLAGADMILMPSDFPAAYEGVLEALQTGEITEDRLDESVRRIITAKLKLQYN